MSKCWIGNGPSDLLKCANVGMKKGNEWDTVRGIFLMHGAGSGTNPVPCEAAKNCCRCRAGYKYWSSRSQAETVLYSGYRSGCCQVWQAWQSNSHL
jgi:hypothetical protein